MTRWQFYLLMANFVIAIAAIGAIEIYAICIGYFDLRRHNHNGGIIIANQQPAMFWGIETFFFVVLLAFIWATIKIIRSYRNQ